MSVQMISRYLAGLSILIFCASAFADSPADPNASATRLKLVSHLYGLYVDAPDKNARVAGTIIELNFFKTLTPELLVNINGGLRLEGGSSRALYDDEFAPRQTPLLREASVNWTPLEECKFSVGSLNQNFLGSPMIVQDQSYPGLHESCHLRFHQFTFGAEAEQTYATDTQFTHPTGRSLQSDSQFFIERLSFGFVPDENLAFELHLSHYLFSGLSALVAYDSQFLGNTSSGVNDKNADFVYEYNPYEVGLGGKANFKDFTFGANVSAIENPGAPSDRNKAWMVQLNPGYTASPRYRWETSLRYYHLDSDATPSFFNDASMAHANVTGVGASVKLIMPEAKTEAEIIYTLSHPIDATLYQPSDQSWAFAVLRFNYDIL